MSYSIRLVTRTKSDDDASEIDNIVDALTYFGVSSEYLDNNVVLHGIDSEEKLHKILTYMRAHPLIEQVDFEDSFKAIFRP